MIQKYFSRLNGSPFFCSSNNGEITKIVQDDEVISVLDSQVLEEGEVNGKLFSYMRITLSSDSFLGNAYVLVDEASSIASFVK